VLGVDVRAQSASTAGRAISSNVTISGGVQTVRMTQKPSGYEPADTVVYAGVPIRWEVTSTSHFVCSAFLRIPSTGFQQLLQNGVNIIDLPAMDQGSTTFTCAMGMYSGHFIAVDPPAPSASPIARASG
jgi:plastocyanin domain-containing protein